MPPMPVQKQIEEVTGTICNITPVKSKRSGHRTTKGHLSNAKQSSRIQKNIPKQQVRIHAILN